MKYIFSIVTASIVLILAHAATLFMDGILDPNWRNIRYFPPTPEGKLSAWYITSWVGLFLTIIGLFIHVCGQMHLYKDEKGAVRQSLLLWVPALLIIIYILVELMFFTAV